MTTTTGPMQIRRAGERGTTDLGWLKGRHSFSFGRYHDPDNMGFRALRVINDDVIAPGAGFDTHPHRNMEILTWVLRGVLRHKDSTGNEGTLRPGELQAMSAGRGIRHSEFNDSGDQPLRLLQIWIEPRTLGTEPSYAQRAFDASARRDRWQTLASPDGREGSLAINQDATLSVADLSPGASISLDVGAGRHGYLHVATGAVAVNGSAMKDGDGARIAGDTTLRISAEKASQVLAFDLA